MPYASFHDYFPDIAEKETRTITVFENSPWDLPLAHYSLLEMYCDEPDCDCRRVFFYVVSSLTNEAMAVIAYGWESPEFYAEWMGDDDPETIKDLKGPVLNLASPQSSIAPSLLDMIQKVVLEDQTYIHRLKTHYRIFRHYMDTKAKKKTKRHNKSIQRT